MRDIILAICIAGTLSIQLRHENTPQSAEAQTPTPSPGCRIVSPVPGAAFGPSSTIVTEDRYFQVEGHMYDFSAGQTFDVHLAVFPSEKDSTEHSARRVLRVEDGRTCVTNSDENTISCFDAFQEHEVDIIADGHDILFKISVILPPVSGRYTFVFRWAQRENNPLVGFCKTDYEILDAEVPADVESLYIPPHSLPIASGGGGTRAWINFIAQTSTVSCFTRQRPPGSNYIEFLQSRSLPRRVFVSQIVEKKMSSSL
jgi:hypothetical protein